MFALNLPASQAAVDQFIGHTVSVVSIFAPVYIPAMLDRVMSSPKLGEMGSAVADAVTATAGRIKDCESIEVGPIKIKFRPRTEDDSAAAA